MAKFLTIRDVAERLQITVQTARRLVQGKNSGRPPIPHTRVTHRDTRIEEEDFLEWCKRHIRIIGK